MTREEAIEVYNGLINEKIKEAFEFFAPELRESEDERIRKELIAFFQDDLRGDYWHDLEVGHILAWLEKQKEQKPAWSEEDENALKYIHELISWGYAEKFMDAQTAHDMRKWVNEHISHDTFQNGNSRRKPGED